MRLRILDAMLVVSAALIIECLPSNNLKAASLVVEVDKVAAWKGDAKAAYSIIHDDYPSPEGIQKYYVELNNRKLRAGFGVIVEELEKGNDHYYGLMQKMVDEGHEIINHSYSHTNLTATGANWDQEVDFSTEILRQRGFESNAYVFPYDRFNDALLERLKGLGYLGARGGSVRGVSPADMDVDDPLAPFRARFDAFYEDPTTGQNTHSIYNSQGDVLKAYVDDAIQKGGWAVRELHGIEDNYWGSVSLAKYRNHLDYVATKIQSNKIWMDTFSNVTRYRASRAYCGDAMAEDGAIIFSMDTSVGCTQYATPLSVIVTVTGVDAIKVTQNAVELPVKPLGSDKYLLEIDPIAGPAYVTSSGCGVEDFKLPNNSWRQISLPCSPPADANTVSSFFQDDDLGVYGESWVVYRYDSTNNDYVKLAVDDTLSQKMGYWIIQKGGRDKHLSLPENSIPTPVANSTGCTRSTTGCIEIPLVTRSTAIQWNMTSYPFNSPGNLGDVRVLTDSGACASGCEMDVAMTEGIVHNQLWTYKGTGYALVTTSDNLDPWTGYWATSLASADGTNPRLLLPKP